ncbi:MAG: hypothetical protein QN778_08780 [Nitrososphaeraceae archaeon]|jgi:hypothetical protein|nr:hypothetical protein [Nitrososphaeraceae archaeon]MDW0291991.1 hypothetical protein [Nitrososphaeraceae archaeon]
MNDKKPITIKDPSTEELIDKIFEKVNQDYKKHRITEAEFYNIQINALIWKELRKITKLLENKE